VNGYLSLTGDNDNAYVIGKSAYSKTDIYNNRIVEYVRNKTRVTVIATTSNTSCTSWGNCQSWTKWYCDTNDASACGNQTCCNSAGGIWKRDCTGYTTTYSCPSGYTKINDSYCYSK